ACEGELREVDAAGRTTWRARTGGVTRALRTCLDLVGFGLAPEPSAEADLTAHEVRRLRGGSVQARRDAVGVLAELAPGSEAAFRALVRAVEDPNPPVRVLAIQGVKKARVPQLIEAFGD